MQYARMGNTGLRLSRLCLGTMNFGPNTPEKEAFQIMDCALDAGINIFDCADMYGWNPNLGGICGTTEELLGRWFRLGNGRRERVVLTTKVYNPMHNTYDGPNDEKGLSAFKIRRRVEDSLRRLCTDHVELYFMHNYDPFVTWDELWEVFQAEIASGKLYYVGASNFGARHLCYAQSEAKKRQMLGIACTQYRYNLLNRMPELELCQTAAELGMGALVWSPLGGGLLSGSVLGKIQEGQRSAKYRGKVSGALLEKLQDYHKLCEDLGESEANVALAWILSNPQITAPIIGPRTLEQMESMIKATEIVLSGDVLERLNEIFPGPAGY